MKIICFLKFIIKYCKKQYFSESFISASTFVFKRQETILIQEVLRCCPSSLILNLTLLQKCEAGTFQIDERLDQLHLPLPSQIMRNWLFFLFLLLFSLFSEKSPSRKVKNLSSFFDYFLTMVIDHLKNIRIW